MKVVVAITGASGSIIGIRLLEELKKLKAETYLMVSDVAREIIKHETDRSMKEVEVLATHSYRNDDFFASVASGSFIADAMVIAPCTMKTLAGIASGFSDNLILRTADVFLKERRKLVVLAREMPLSQIHIENMERASRAGAIIMPPVLSFYSKPKSIDDMVNHVVGKVLDIIGIKNDVYMRWE